MEIRSRNSLDVSDPPRPPAGHSSRARIGTRILLILALAASSIALTQCRRVGDRLTGLDASLFGSKGNCRATCQDAFRERTQAENALHAQRVQACGGNPACLAEEQARHEAALRDSKAQRDACINGCHHQGGGTIGP